MNSTKNFSNTGSSVATVRLKGLHVVRSKGHTYCYAWRGGPRLTSELGTPEFHAEFASARDPFRGLDRRRFSYWITRYKGSVDYIDGVADSTKRTWSPWFDKIDAEFGTLSTRQFDRPDIREDISQWRNQWRIKNPRKADLAKQALSVVLSYVCSQGALKINVCAALPNYYSADRAHIIWEDNDIELICGNVSKEIGWAVHLAAFTGLRQGDLLRLSWPHIRDSYIEVPTAKRRKKSKKIKVARIPITRGLRKLLDTIPKRATTVLTNSYGLPWKQFFSSTWDTAMKKCGLAQRDLHFHDLRGTAATRFFLARLDEREIAVILGWSEDRVKGIIDHYVRRDRIIDESISKLENYERMKRRRKR